MFLRHSLKLYLFLLCFIITFASAPCALGADTADDEEVMVTLDISPKTVRVGDIITLDIFIKHKAGFSLYLPDSIDIAPFDIIDTKVKGLKKEGGTFSKATFKIAIYKIGVFSIPNINLLLKDENRRIEISTPQRKLEVVTTLKDEGNALLDIYPPIDIRQSYLKLLIYVWAVSFMMLAAVLLHLRKKRSAKKEALAKQQQKKKGNPKKAALELLSVIFARENLSILNDKEICENVSFTIKYFIREKFDIGSLEMTSYELVDDLEGIGVKDEFLATLYKMLMTCDMVKFADKPLYRSVTEDGMTFNDDVEKLKNDAMALIQIN
jgi:hypothetical protein